MAKAIRKIPKKHRISPCCNAVIDASRADGVLVGSCSSCGEDVLRIHPKTGKEEWLDGKSPWTDTALRPVGQEERR